ncbi:MAG: Ig-like domain repeat protein [Acidobacteriaceae bacterium]
MVKILALVSLQSLLAQGGIAQAPRSFPGTTAVGQSSQQLNVAIVITGSGVAQAPQAVTQGIAAGDFSLAAGGSCTAGVPYSAGQTCTVAVIFQPKSPGLRTGAVVLRAANGGLLGSTMLAGTALGSLAVLQPGEIDTVVGNGAWTYRGDGGQATQSPIFLPTAVTVDAAGNIYLSDSNNNRVRRVDAATGVISTVAGNGVPGFSGDGGLATQASISTPAGLAIDGAGNIYFADTGNMAVRRVDAVSGIIATVAGTGGVSGYTGDGGQAAAATLNFPEGIRFDAGLNLYIADTGNNVVRIVSATTGEISTVAGTGVAGYNGDGIPSTTALLSSPWDVATSLDGSIFIADVGNNRVRKVDPSGNISTLAGTGPRQFSGDGGLATAANLNAATAVALDLAGNLYIADSGNDRVRRITASTGIIDTITGVGTQNFSGDGGPANLASLYGPTAVFFDSSGNLLVADMFHNRVRRIAATVIALQYATIRVGKTSPAQVEGLENDGNASLTLATPGLVNAALDPATTTCSTTPLASDANCALGVEFAPTVIGNPVLGSVSLNSDAGNSPTVIELSGNVLTVNPTMVAVTSSANPSVVNAAVTFVATVVSGGASPGGTINFLDGNNAICSNVALTEGGTANCTTSALALGQHSITANYSGDPNNASAVSTPLTQVVQQAVTVVLGATPNPSIVASSVMLTATVSAATGTPSGTVTFYDGAAVIGSASLVSGVATLSTVQLTPGIHSLSAKYSGDPTNAAGISNLVSETVNEGTTHTTLATSNGNVNFGATITLTATVSTTDGPAPTGIMQFKEGSAVLGTGSVDSMGNATFTFASLPPGSHNIIAAYIGDGNDAASNSAPLLEVVQQIVTTTTLTSDLNPASAGAVVHFIAKLSVAAGGTANGPFTGQVTFKFGATVLGIAAVDATGAATITVGTLPVGGDSIIASYAGDSNYVPNASSAFIETITQAGMSLTLAGPATVNVATPTVFTVALTVNGPVPNGTLTLQDGGVAIGVQAVTASGTFTFTTSSLALGRHTLTAVFSGDPNYATTTSNAATTIVQQASTTTSLQSSLNPQIIGLNVTFTASVSSPSPNITGSITLQDGATAIGSAPVNAAGVTSFTLSTLTFGAHPLTAIYSGDTNHVASTSIVLTQKIVQPATTALASSNNPATATSSVVFTAQLTGTASLTPTGVITFRDGANVLAAVTVDAAGSATFSTTSLLVGTHSITASYAGDQNFAAVTSTALLETIQNASTQIVLSASSNPAIYATPLTLTATITTNGAIATGPVTFTDAGRTIGTGLLNAGGVATLTTSTLAAGPHTIVANYAGDRNTSVSVSTPFALVVEQLTSTTLATSTNPALTLSSVVLTAAVTATGNIVPTGTITFMDGNTLLGTATLDAQGHAAITVPSLAAGNHPLTAIYSGDSINFPSSANLTQGVQLRPTNTALTATATNAANNQQVTLIAVVRWTGPTTPTGTMSFSSGGTVLGSMAVDATGVATMTIFVSSGTQSIDATYSGDATYASSGSILTAITGGPATQFTLAVDPSSITLQTTQHGTVNVTVASVKGFTDTLEFGCLGLPFAATCTFSNSQMTVPPDGTQTLQLTIDTGNPLGAGASASNAHSPGVLFCFVPGALLGGFLLRRRKRGLPMLAVVALVLGMGTLLSATGCSGLHISGTPPGTYSFTVSATGAHTGASVSQTMTLTVTQ